MTEKEALIALNLVKGLGSIKIKALLEHFKSALNIFGVSSGELKRAEGISSKLISGINEIKNSARLKEELELIKKNNVTTITINDENYPKNLKEIYDPPIVLYVKGDILTCDDTAVGIVGSRRASYYGLSFAERIGYELANLGITVVSGMARGIDTKAHRGVLRAKARTIAVLGSGLNNIYPPENKRLSEEIAQFGAVVSEFPLNTKPLAGNFPRRNRVISGLSLGIVVVEAARNSGALITARLGLEQGREIFSVPGRVDSRISYGTNQLIKDGAKLLNTVDDILEELNLRLKEKLQSTKNEDFMPKRLNEIETSIYSTLTTEPMHVEEIVKSSHLELNTTLSYLLQLELKGLIRKLPGELFVRRDYEKN